MRHIYLFNVGIPSVHSKMREIYGKAVCSIPTVTRLIGARPVKEDVIVIAESLIEPRLIEIKLGSCFPFLVFYNQSKETGLKPLTVFGHSVYLPFEASPEEITKAVAILTEISTVIGTIEDEVIGSSPQMIRLREQIRSMIERKRMSVHLEGETGTGKTAIAQLIHPRFPDYLTW